MAEMVKKLFKHGGSYAVDIPKAFVKDAAVKEVILKITPKGEINISQKTELDSIESEPEFAEFIKTIARDALKNPSKLKNVKEVWDKEWEELLKGVSCDDK